MAIPCPVTQIFKTNHGLGKVTPWNDKSLKKVKGGTMKEIRGSNAKFALNLFKSHKKKLNLVKNWIRNSDLRAYVIQTALKIHNSHM